MECKQDDGSTAWHWKTCFDGVGSGNGESWNQETGDKWSGEYKMYVDDDMLI